LPEKSFREQLQESRGKRHFRSAVLYALRQPIFSPSQVEHHRTEVTKLVFGYLKQNLEHPAARHMNLHHEYSKKERGKPMVRKWSEHKWNFLQKIMEAKARTTQETAYNTVIIEMTEQIGRVLRDLESEGVIEKLDERKFKVVKEVPSQ